MSDSVPVIQVQDVSKRFVLRKDKSVKERLVNMGRSRRHREEFWALRDVDLEIDSGATVGLIGPNGSGKSTLLKAIGGIIQPTSGRVLRRGRLAALLELGAGFHPDLTGRENVYLNASILGLSREQTDRHFDAIVDFSGIETFIDTQVKFYSSGMYVRLAFAVAVHVDPDVLLVDEVLAVGDEPFQRKCMEKIRSFQADGRTIVLVSHALDQVGELCDRAIVLEHGRVAADGDPRDALRVLRKEFDDAQRHVAAEARSRAPSPGTRVDSVTVNGAPSGAIELAPASDLEVGVRVVAGERGLQSWMVGIGLDTTLGQHVYGTHTQMLGVDLEDLAPGTSRLVTLRMRRPALGPGAYTLHAAVATTHDGELHRDSNAALVQVRGRDDQIGVLDVVTEVLPEPPSP